MKTTITLGILAIFLIAISSNLRWYNNDFKFVLQSDAKGYYAYLPAVFVYQDLNYTFFDAIEKEKYYDENLLYDYRLEGNEFGINRYFCGVAVLQTPFFLIGHALSGVLGFDSDGYSKIYLILFCLGAIFYALLGLFFMDRILQRFGVNEWARILTLVVTIFGTNAFYYTLCEPGMSHIYSFALLTMFFFLGQCYFDQQAEKYLPLLGGLLGLILIVRPVNGLILLALPFAAGTWERFRVGLVAAFKNWPRLLLGLSACIAVIFIQLSLYKIGTGSFFVYSYGEQGFNFLEPHFFDILFSYKKGLFLYTPMYLFAFIGVFYYWEKTRFGAMAWLLFFVLITYVFSSWGQWFYGGSFSSRVYVDVVGLVMLFFGIALQNISRRSFKIGFLISTFLLVTLCQIQTFQYRRHQIHWCDMTKEKYWDAFLRVDKL